MIGSARLPVLLVSALIAWPVHADAPDKRVEKLRAAERSLLENTAKLRLRHNIERLAADWRALAVAASGADRAAALEGEARALALLAKWSGTDVDKANAARAQEKLRLKPAGKIAEPKKKTVKAASLARIELETRELGIEILLPKHAGLGAKTELLAATRKEGPRLYFDVSPMIAHKRALGAIQVDHPAITRVRVGQSDPDTVRFVFELPAGRPAPELVALIDGDAPRLRVGKKGAWDARKPKVEKTDPLAALLELQRALDTVAPGEAASVTPEAQEALEAMVADLREESPSRENTEAAQALADSDVEIEISLPDLPATPPGVNKTTRAALAEKKGSLVRVRRVLIDAGHGGKDGGATGKRGTKEKDVNLAIALALAKVLRERLGVEVVLTRSTDVYLSLGKRVEIANKADADLFVSVHSNAHRKRTFQGIETYYLNTTSNRYANRLAARENSEQFDEGSLDSGDPSEGAGEDDAGSLPGGSIGRDLRLLLADLAMRSATDDSRRLAGLVQSNLIGHLRKVSGDITDLGVKHALFYVLLGARMPSILVESGFLSHPDEERRLADPAYQRKVAEAIAAGIAKFAEERNQVASRL